MKDLPTEVARVVDTMKVGEISVPFQMTNARGKVVCAIVKLKERIPEHRATITEDFQAMRDIVTAKRRKGNSARLGCEESKRDIRAD